MVIHDTLGQPLQMTHMQNRVLFEDHSVCGPVLITKDGNPRPSQPDDDNVFWLHYDAWAAQGKRLQPGYRDVALCIYETRMMRVRAAGKSARASHGIAAQQGDSNE